LEVWWRWLGGHRRHAGHRTGRRPQVLLGGKAMRQSGRHWLEWWRAVQWSSGHWRDPGEARTVACVHTVVQYLSDVKAQVSRGACTAARAMDSAVAMAA